VIYNPAEPLSDKEADLMDESAIRPFRGDPSRRQHGCHPAPAATVGLMTAARALGISPDEADDLAGRGEFPCNVIATGEGYRVSFAALLRVLSSGPIRAAGGDSAP